MDVSVSVRRGRLQLQSLQEKCGECERDVNIKRDQLKVTRSQIESLQKEAQAVSRQLESTNENHIYDRLIASKAKISDEIENEKKQECRVKSELLEMEQELQIAILEYSQFAEIENEIIEKEIEIEQIEKGNAKRRQIIEEQNAVNTIKNLAYKLKEQEEENILKDEELKKQINAGIAARKQTLHLIRDSATQQIQNRDKLEEIHKKYHDARIKDVLKLKDQLKYNRENLAANEARKIATGITNLAKEEEKLQNLVKSGVDRDQAEDQIRREHLEKRREKEDQKLLVHQEAAKVAIIEKIVAEEKNLLKRKKQNPILFKSVSDSNRPTELQYDNKINQMKRVQKLQRDRGKDDHQAGDHQGDKSRVPVSHKSKLPAIDNRVGQQDSDSEDEMEDMILVVPNDSFDSSAPKENRSKVKSKVRRSIIAQRQEDLLVAPEFDGMWNTDATYQDQSGDNIYLDGSVLSAKDNRQTVAASTVPKANDFVAKPDIIHFADFTVDTEKYYTRTIQLTNVSYQISSIRFVSLSINLRDFCTVDFIPSGPLSPGMSTSFKLTFRPALLSAISGDVTFSTPNGQFQVPVQCIPPQVEPEIDMQSVEFGRQTVGEKIKRFVTIRNKGALDGEFTVKLHKDGEEEIHNPELVGSILTELTTTPESGGGLPAKSEQTVTISYSPRVPGLVISQFEIKVLRKESKDDCNDLEVCTFILPITAEAIEVPVSLSETEFDLNVCTHGFLYQDQFSVINSANTAKVVTFTIPVELRAMMEVLPKTGYVQAKSSMQAQLKFQPELKLLEELVALDTPYFDPETGVIEAPVTLSVADQARPLELFVTAITTGAELQLTTNDLDFGSCTIYESVTKKIKLTNETYLPQKFGFLDLPSYIQVRPDYGFVTICPDEEIEIEFVFSAPRAAEFNFELVLQSLRGFKSNIKCRGIGVHPPLRLSRQHIEFSTPLHDTHRSSFYIYNDHVDDDEFRHPVPRIANGPVFPVGPTSFCFMLPEDCCLTFSPLVGTIKPGEKQYVTVMCNPDLKEKDIMNEAKNIHLGGDTESSLNSTPRKGAGGQNSNAGSSSSNTNMRGIDRKKSVARLGRKKSETGGFKVGKDTSLYWNALNNLTRDYTSTTVDYQIPCYIAPGEIPREISGHKGGTVKSYAIENCLWVSIHVQRQRPAIVVKNDCGKPAVDFGMAPVGEIEKKTLYIENISTMPVDMKSSLLDPHGPFQLLNPLCELEPGEQHALLLTFRPLADKVYHEVLYIHQPSSVYDTDGNHQDDGRNISETTTLRSSACSAADSIRQHATLNISFRGKGVRPSCSLQGATQNDQLDLGVVRPMEETEQVLMLKNSSTFELRFRILLDSEKDAFLANNRNGHVLFDCSPASGTVAVNEEIKLRVTFQPDHAGYFVDTLRLRLFGHTEDYSAISLHGLSVRNSIYLSGVDFASSRRGAGVGFSSSDIPLAESVTIIGEPALVHMKKIDGLFVGSFEVKALKSLAGKSGKADFEIRHRNQEIVAVQSKPSLKNIKDTGSTSALEKFGFQVSPERGSIDVGQSMHVTIKCEKLGAKPIKQLKIELRGDQTFIHDLVLSENAFDRTKFPDSSLASFV